MSLSEMVSLRVLYLYSNSIHGVIPNTIGNIYRMTDLQLQNNYLQGTIPSQIGNLLQLASLNLRCNQLVGTIPMQLSTQLNLAKLQLGYNHLTGPFPDELGSDGRMIVLDLIGNNFGGTISASFCLLHLQSFTVCFNNGTGCNDIQAVAPCLKDEYGSQFNLIPNLTSAPTLNMSTTTSSSPCKFDKP